MKKWIDALEAILDTKIYGKIKHLRETVEHKVKRLAYDHVNHMAWRSFLAMFILRRSHSWLELISMVVENYHSSNYMVHATNN